MRGLCQAIAGNYCSFVMILCPEPQGLYLKFAWPKIPPINPRKFSKTKCSRGDCVQRMLGAFLSSSNRTWLPERIAWRSKSVSNPLISLCIKWMCNIDKPDGIWKKTLRPLSRDYIYPLMLHKFLLICDFTFITLGGKLFFSNAGIKDRADEYAKLFVDNQLVHNTTNTLFGRINIFSA